MSSQEATPQSGGTTSGDYGASYYNDAHLGGSGDYSWDSDEWRTFNRGLADRIIAIANPKTTLDVGAAKGLLVQALAEKGVDSRGLDISEHAIATAHEDVRGRLEVGSATRPIEGRYDLITCIEVLEHMDPRDAQLSIDVMCAATDQVLFSSSPGDFHESTHINTHPTSDWVAAFAERGFFRRTDVNLDFLTPWAVLFERAALQPRDIVHRYETHLVPLTSEVQEKRRALLEMHRHVSDLDDRLANRVDPDTETHIANLEAELESARHEVLTTRDHIIGLEAEAVRLQTLTDRLNSRVRSQQKRIQKMRTRLTNVRRRADRAERTLAAVKGSRAWRVGTMLTGSSKSPKL